MCHSADPAPARRHPKNCPDPAHLAAASAIRPIPRPARRHPKNLSRSRAFARRKCHSADPALARRHPKKLSRSRAFARRKCHSADPAPGAPPSQKTVPIPRIRPLEVPFGRSRARRAAIRKNCQDPAHLAPASAIRPIPRPTRHAKKLVESCSSFVVAVIEKLK
jgi:hypothetical protein